MVLWCPCPGVWLQGRGEPREEGAATVHHQGLLLPPRSNPALVYPPSRLPAWASITLFITVPGCVSPVLPTGTQL